MKNTFLLLLTLLNAHLYAQKFNMMDKTSVSKINRFYQYVNPTDTNFHYSKVFYYSTMDDGSGFVPPAGMRKKAKYDSISKMLTDSLNVLGTLGGQRPQTIYHLFVDTTPLQITQRRRECPSYRLIIDTTGHIISITQVMGMEYDKNPPDVLDKRIMYLLRNTVLEVPKENAKYIYPKKYFYEFQEAIIICKAN